MDITPLDNSAQPISDDQELAKALAGVMPDEPESEKPVAPEIEIVDSPAMPDPLTASSNTSSQIPTLTVPDATDASSADTSNSTAGLDDIKLDALKELRPLMDKVDIPADEKFNTYLMLIRSTDDATLIAPAHLAAQNITDEKQKANALLEIIKEIDYLSHKENTPPTA